MRHLAGKSLVLRIIAAAMTYAFFLVMAQIMDVADFGIMGAVLSASLLFSVIGCMGQQMSLLRFVPPLVERGGTTPPNAAIANAFRRALIGNLFVFVLLALAVLVSQMDRAAVIAFGLLIVPLTGVVDMQAHLARAYRSIVLALLPKDVLWRFLSGTILVIVFFAADETKVPLALAFAVLAGVLGVLIGGQGALLRRRLGVPPFLRLALMGPVPNLDPAWERARQPLWVASVAAVVFTNLDVVAAGALISPEAVALYFAANRIALVPGLILMSYNIAIGPLFARHYAAGRVEELHKVARSASLQVFLPTLALVAGLELLAGPVLRLFGPEFREAENVLRLLLLAALANGTFGPSELLLTMCGRERAAMTVGFVATVVGACTITIGALAGDLLGLALGTLVAMLIARYLSWMTVRRHLGFSADAVSAFVALQKGRHG